MDLTQSRKPLAVTLTLNNLVKRGRKKDLKTQLLEQHKRFQQYIALMTYNYLKEFDMYYEFTLNGNLHVHGICIVRDEYSIKEVQTLMNLYAKSLGFADIKPVVHYEAWVQYIKKDIENTSKIMNEIDLDIKIHRIFKMKKQSEINIQSDAQSVNNKVYDL